jgi:hypothetical protein
MQHAKETCLVAVKGIGFDGLRPERLNDLIIGWRNIPHRKAWFGIATS